MKYTDCPVHYVEQKGRTFDTVYRHHTQTIRNSNSNLGYPNQVLNTGHAYWGIRSNVNIVKTQKENT